MQAGCKIIGNIFLLKLNLVGVRTNISLGFMLYCVCMYVYSVHVFPFICSWEIFMY